MAAAWHLLLRLAPLLLALAFFGWFLWHCLRRSDEPGALLRAWVFTGLMLWAILFTAARFRGNWGPVMLMGLIGAGVMTLLWRRRIAEFFGDQIASVYTGGSAEVDPAPFFSGAHAKRKRGKYHEALAEVQTQLQRFPTNFDGWMLLAEIQAEDLKDLAGAQETVAQLLTQSGHAPKNIAYALNREADWHLKLARDPVGARTALERVVELLPDTEQAQLALQRIAHLAPAPFLESRQQPRSLTLQHSEERIGLMERAPELRPVEEDPSVTAAKYVQHLEQFPYDNEAREKLALIYAKHYRRLDLATDQLEQLIACPNQPAKQVVHWLNMLADVQVDLGSEVVLAQETLQRIVDLYPKTAAAQNALNRLAHVKLELRPKQQSQAVKLGSYEQNIGLKPGGSRRTSG